MILRVLVDMVFRVHEMQQSNPGEKRKVMAVPKLLTQAVCWSTAAPVWAGRAPSWPSTSYGWTTM